MSARILFQVATVSINRLKTITDSIKRVVYNRCLPTIIEYGIVEGKERTGIDCSRISSFNIKAFTQTNDRTRDKIKTSISNTASGRRDNNVF